MAPNLSILVNPEARRDVLERTAGQVFKLKELKDAYDSDVIAVLGDALEPLERQQYRVLKALPTTEQYDALKQAAYGRPLGEVMDEAVPVGRRAASELKKMVEARRGSKKLCKDRKEAADELINAIDSVPEMPISLAGIVVASVPWPLPDGSELEQLPTRLRSAMDGLFEGSLSLQDEGSEAAQELSQSLGAVHSAMLTVVAHDLLNPRRQNVMGRVRGSALGF